MNLNTRTSFWLAIVLLVAVSSPAWAWKVKITQHPDGDYVASLIHDTEPAQNRTVGKYSSKKEARKAGKAAKKEANGFMDDGSEACSDPLIRC